MITLILRIRTPFYENPFVTFSNFPKNISVIYHLCKNALTPNYLQYLKLRVEVKSSIMYKRCVMHI